MTQSQENPYTLIQRQFELEQHDHLFGFLYENIFSALNHCICEALLPPGTIIQEKHLADVLHISRTPLRQALGMLTESGLLETRPGCGFTVPRITAEMFHSANSARRAFETSCAELAAQNATRDDLLCIKEKILEMKDCHLQNTDYESIRKFAKNDLAFHTQICLASKNEHLIKAYKDLEPRLIHMRYQTIYGVVPVPTRLISSSVQDEHLIIYMAIRNKNSRLAYEAMLNHLENSLSIWGMSQT